VETRREEPHSEESRRLRSLDALRGFDMLWIVGGATLVAALAEATGWGWLGWIEGQCEHVEWHGFRFWDLIFPLFLFLAGVSMPFSFAKRRGQGASDGTLARHALRRGLTLVFLGVVYNGLLAFDFATLRYASVLGRIGLGWMFAALIALRCGVRGQVAWIAGLLLGYWAALTLVPVPGQGAPSLEPGRTLADWLDRTLLPGRLHREVRDPEGILSTVPAVATALSGALAGAWLRRADVAGDRRAAGLALAGLGALALGGLWQLAFPLNKNLWTSSFVAWTSGWSLLALAAFYWVIDVRG
jgi:predicted acyltransferase